MKLIIPFFRRQRKTWKITLLYPGDCSVDECLDRGSILKLARDEITKRYNQRVNCQVGSGGYGFYGSDLRMPFDGIYQLSKYFVVNLEATHEENNEILKGATLEFISCVPEKLDVLLSSDKRLEKEIRQTLSELKTNIL